MQSLQFFVTIIIRTFTRQILVNKLGIENNFTSIVFFDIHKLSNAKRILQSNLIDWESLYPFETKKRNCTNINTNIVEIKSGTTNKYQQQILSLQEKIRIYATDYLIWYKMIVGLANKYENTIRWNYASYAEYNGSIKLSDGQLTAYIEPRDINGAAESMISFAEYCKRNNIDFIYVQAPYKISEVQDKKISGIMDFSNQNANALIKQLVHAGIDVYDLRERIESENLNHHRLFYRTDHHWLAETGLWASHHILNYLNQKYKYDIDASILNSSQFKRVLYPKWFLGSQGKKVTLSVTTPEDFSLFYPTYKTAIHFAIPDADIDLEGDFSIIYDMKSVEYIDYYDKNPYGAYMYGDHATASFENHLSTNNLRLLFIHDSFGNSVIPFVSLGVKHIDCIDLRHFTGSVQNFIEKEKPDAVIVLYNPSSIKSSAEIHKATFDFR